MRVVEVVSDNSGLLLGFQRLFLLPAIYGCFRKSWYPVSPNHPLKNRVFHFLNHPFWGTTIFGFPPIERRFAISEKLEEIGSFTLRAYEEYASKTTANAAGSGSPGRFFQQGNCIMEFLGWFPPLFLKILGKMIPFKSACFFCQLDGSTNC